MYEKNLQLKWENLQSLIENRYQYLSFVLQEYKKYISKFQTIFLCGSGNDAKLAVDYLSDVLDKKDVYFIDKNSEKHGRKLYNDISCYGKERIYGSDPKTTLMLITSAWYANEIYGELRRTPYHENMSDSASKLYDIPLDRNFISLLFSYLGGNGGICKIWEHMDELTQIFYSFEDVESAEIYCKCLYFRISGMEEPPCATYPQYFPKCIKSRLTDMEVFLDCGASDGDSIKEFRLQTEDRFRAIYSFEMDSECYARLEKASVSQDSRVKLLHAGVSDQKRKVHYKPSGCPSYVHAEDFSVGVDLLEADLVAIDGLVEDGFLCDTVTFVKMDIEGAEMDALRGMEQLMKRDKPKLAISLYHKLDDLWEIPKYIHTIVPEYKFILRHHSDTTMLETILYAYVE